MQQQPLLMAPMAPSPMTPTLAPAHSFCSRTSGAYYQPRPVCNVCSKLWEAAIYWCAKMVNSTKGPCLYWLLSNCPFGQVMQCYLLNVGAHFGHVALLLAFLFLYWSEPLQVQIYSEHPFTQCPCCSAMLQSNPSSRYSGEGSAHCRCLAARTQACFWPLSKSFIKSSSFGTGKPVETCGC